MSLKFKPTLGYNRKEKNEWTTTEYESTTYPKN